MMGVEYFLESSDGAFMLVASDWDDGRAYESFRVFAGNSGEKMSEIKLESKDGYQSKNGYHQYFQPVRRVRDGGSTWITTEKGVLFVPTPFAQNRIASWTVPGQPPIALAVLDTKTVDFNIETLTVCLKS